MVNIKNKDTIDHIHTVLLYMSDTGKIRHVHQEVFMKGTTRLSPKEIESKALQLAKNNKNLKMTDISILHLPGEDIEDNSSYEVDVQNKRLVKQQSG